MKLRFDKRTAAIYYPLLFILLYATTFFAKNSLLENVQFVLVLVLLVNIGLSYRKLDKFDGLVLLFSTYVIAISALHHTLSFGILYSQLLITVLPIYVKKELARSNVILQCLYSVSVVVVLLNFITLFLPLGLDSENHPVYLLGGKNALAVYEIPMLYYFALYSYVRHSKLTLLNLSYILLIIASLIIGGSSTGVVVALLCVMYLICQKVVNLGYRMYVAIFAVIQAIVLNVAVLQTLPYVSNFIYGYLGKDLTFTGRVYIWDIAAKAINASFFGYGRGNSVISSQSLLSECHNTVLEVLLTGGPILLVMFALVIFAAFAFKKTKENKQLYHLSSFFLFAYLIISLMESTPFKIDLWIMLALFASTNSILANIPKKKAIE